MIDCRPGCGACCIAPSINSPLPGMPEGKPAGIACRQLTADYRCAIFGRPDRPAFCAGLTPSTEMCGQDRAQALAWLNALETATRPAQAVTPCVSAPDSATPRHQRSAK